MKAQYQAEGEGWAVGIGRSLSSWQNDFDAGCSIALQVPDCDWRASRAQVAKMQLSSIVVCKTVSNRI